MQTLKNTGEKGVSLRRLSLVMLIISILIAAMLLVALIRTFRSYKLMENTTDQYIILQQATSDLMQASDYLTEEAQSYTVMRERKHMENYFTEAEVTRRRDNAIITMEAKLPDSTALTNLKAGMAESVSLMDREYYAMRLMMEALGDEDYPEAIRNVTLSEEHSVLNPEDKILLAQRMMHDDTYYEQKNRIRADMTACIAELKAGVHGDQQNMEEQTHRKMIVVSGLIILQTAAIFLMLWLTTKLGVNPVLRAVDHIKKDQKIPIVGASEFRYLAGTYNVMYSAYKKSIESLNYKASHDELTGAYNRAGYDLIRESLDMNTTAMLLFDADQFKTINDQYGHETGDRVLQKITATLQNNFRSDDYVCRIGGDEFVVFMAHVSGDKRQLIENKVKQINRDLSAGADGLPPVTLSVGVSFNPEGNDSKEMFRQADIALYYVKDHGRDGVSFYTDELKGKTKPEQKQ